MKIFLYFCLAWLSMTACSRKMSTPSSSPGGDTSKEIFVSSGTTSEPIISECIQKKIDSILQQPVWNPPAEIHLYTYDGRKVYEISADCCDRFSTAVDQNCNYICAPSGGFTGQGDRKCADFYQKAKHLGLIWKDKRERKK